jgi:hypothetical protein
MRYLDDHDCCVGKELEGEAVAYFRVLSWYSSLETEESHENFSQDSR